jgi:PKD repeat protein
VAFDALIGLAICDRGNNRVRAVLNLGEASSSPPTAIILTTPDHLGAAPLKIHFDGSLSEDADGDIRIYEWDFGDGTKGFGAVVDHVYTTTGSYTATLTVTDSQANSSTAKATIFAAKPLIASATNGKGAYKVSFSPKTTKPSDSFALAMKNVEGLANVVGKQAVINIGTFTITTTVAGKGVKVADKITKLTIDPIKKTVTLAIKGVVLKTALGELGVINENTVAPGKTVFIPVVINVNNGELVVGDKFLFINKAKFNKGATGKFSQ